MADKPQYAIVARPKNYWMSARAVSITLNALNEANRIQASTAAGAQIFVYFDEYQKIGDRETFGYDAGHNFNSWPLTVYPTYFGTYEAVHVHAAIPRTEAVGQQAMFVYPTAILDVEGYEVEAVPMQDDDGNYIDEKGNIVDDPDDAATAYVRKKKTDGSEQDADPVGSQNYYYICLHGMLTGSGTAGTTFREWNPMYDTGRLNTDETWGEAVTLEQLAREMKKKVDVEWFQRIFKIHGTDRQRVPTDWDDDGKPIEWETDDDGNFIYEGDDERRDIKPNDMEHEITDTESMFGTWTQHWLSALGIGSGSGGSGGGGGGGDALDEPLLSINQMVATPTTAGQTLVWKGIGLGINGSGWDFDTAGMSQQEIQTLFDSRYLKLTSQSPQSVTSDITLNGLLTIDHGQGFDPTQVDSNVVLTKGETLTLLDGRYVTVAFWNSLFETYNNKTKVNVNTANPVIDNLKILVGTWTEQYLSALGIGSGGGGGGGAALDEPLLSINQIGSNPSDANQTLVFDGSHWTYGSAGLDTEALGQYLSTNKYLTESGMTGYEWWGQKFSANSKVISGDMTGVGDITAANDTKVITGFRLKASLFLSSHNAGGTSGSTGWVNVAKITVVSAWASQPLKFRVTQRGRMGAELTVRFLDADSAAGTTISEFYYTGDIAGARIVQSGTEFYLYIQKTGAYDSIGISLVDLGSYANGTFTVEWRDVHSSTAPGATVATCRYYFASNVYMEYDSTNSGVHLVGAGLYADTYLSALGTGSGGGAGGGMDLEAMWAALGGTYRTNEQISASHLTNVTKALTITVNGTAKTYNGTSAQSVSINTASTIEGATDVSSYFTNDKKALDADKLDGKDLSELFETLKNSTASGHDNDIEVKVGGVTKYLTVGYATSSGTAAACSGNAGTATKLAASVKLWGNDFNGSGNVSGAMTFSTLAMATDYTDVWSDGTNSHPWYGYDHRYHNTGVFSTTITDYSGMTLHTSEGWLCMTGTGGKVGIGTTSPQYKLDVAGTIRLGSTSYANLIGISNQYLELGSDGNEIVISGGQSDTMHVNYRGSGLSKSIPASWQWHAGTGSSWADFVLGTLEAKTSIKIGSITIKNENGGLHIIGGGLYTDTYLSALGTGSGGSGGGSDFGFALNGTTLSVGTKTSVDLGNTFVSIATSQTITGAKAFYGNVGIGGTNTNYNFFVRGSSNFNGDIYSSGNVGIGASAQSGYKLYVNGGTNVNGKLTVGNLSISKSANDGKMTISTASTGSGLPPCDLTLSAGNIYISAALSFTGNKSYSASDMRYKDVLENISCDVDTIARAPIFDFKWKDDEYNNISLGSSAQYWKAVFPNAVKAGPEGRYFLDYSATALAAAVMTARTVLTHDEEIARLKRRIGELEQEIETLKAA